MLSSPCGISPNSNALHCAYGKRIMPKLKTETTVRPSVERRILAYLELQQQIKTLAKQADDLKSDINSDLLKADDNTIETDDFKAVLVKSTNSRIDSELLLKLGVTPSIIRRATKETPYAYPKVTAKVKNA
jgi:hypothetical protein